MDKHTIISKYLYLVHRLERGYREDLKEIIDLIFLEKYKDKLPNSDFL